jgi:hypothetical protein
MFLKSRLFLIVTSLLAGIRGTRAAVIKIVSPSEYENTEGEGGFLYEGAYPPFRFQQVFPAEDFGAPDDIR